MLYIERPFTRVRKSLFYRVSYYPNQAVKQVLLWITRASLSIFYRRGYDLQWISDRLSQDVNSVATLTVKESQYYTRWSTPCPVFTPWAGHPDFQNIYDGVASRTIVSPERCYILVSLARYAAHLQGDFAESGVQNGGTALLLCRVLQGSNKKLYLFDSFKGLPKPNPTKDIYFHEGQYAADSVTSVKQLLNGFQNIVDIREGWMPDTFSGLENNSYAFVHIDVDLYKSALDCCEYFYPHLVPGGILLFDEYGFPAARGEKDAVDEFFADKPEKPITLLTGQAMVIKAGTNPSRGNRLTVGFRKKS